MYKVNSLSHCPEPDLRFPSNPPISHQSEAQCVTSRTNNSSLDCPASKLRVRVGHRSQSPSQRLVTASAKIIVAFNSVSLIGAIERLLTIDKCVGFDENLRTVASVDSVCNFIEVAVENVPGSESDRWRAGVDVVPVIIVVCDAQMPGIFGAV